MVYAYDYNEFLGPWKSIKPLLLTSTQPGFHLEHSRL